MPRHRKAISFVIRDRLVLSVLQFVVFSIALALPAFGHAGKNPLASSWMEVQLVIFSNDGLSSREKCLPHEMPVSLFSRAQFLQTPSELSSRQLLDSLAEKSENKVPENSQDTPRSDALSTSLSDLEENFMVWLPPEGKFASVIAKLEASQNYSVLYTARWRMPLKALDKKVSIIIDPSKTNTGNSRDPQKDQISGVVSFFKKNPFYIHSNLIYHQKSPDNARSQIEKTDCDFPVLRVQRFKPGVLTYVDNPKVGIIFNTKLNRQKDIPDHR